MSDSSSSSASSSSHTESEHGIHQNVQPYQYEPVAEAGVEEDDDVFNPQEHVEIVPPAADWCACTNCQDMPTRAEALCCQHHPAERKLGERLPAERDVPWGCIIEHPGVEELLADAPLEVMWSNYLCYHKDLFPGAPVDQRKRLCAYRSMAFWLFDDLGRKERRPLPACLVNYIRAHERFCPTDNDELFADWAFKGFLYGDINLPAN